MGSLQHGVKPFRFGWLACMRVARLPCKGEQRAVAGAANLADAHAGRRVRPATAAAAPEQEQQQLLQTQDSQRELMSALVARYSAVAARVAEIAADAAAAEQAIRNAPNAALALAPAVQCFEQQLSYAEARAQRISK